MHVRPDLESYRIEYTENMNMIRKNSQNPEVAMNGTEVEPKKLKISKNRKITINDWNPNSVVLSREHIGLLYHSICILLFYAEGSTRAIKY